MRNLLKILFYLALVASMNTALASKHHLFLIHGIGDSKSAFGSSSVVFNELLNESSVDTQFIINHFEYRTGTDSLGTMDFAKSFSLFFKDYFKNKTLNDTDKFSIFAHSQGGLVTMNWLYHSFKGDEGFSDFSFIREHMKTFISAATPYGGTEVITLALLFKRLRQYFKFGQIELEDMYYPSEMVAKMKRLLLGEEQEFLGFLHSLNVLNVVGVTHKLPRLSSSALRLQDDSVIPVSSAAMNFYYLKNHKIYFPGENQKISSSETKFYKNATVVPVNAAHIPVLFVPGLVKIPVECGDLFECNHPAFEFYLNHLLERPLPKVKEKIRSFVIKLKLEVSNESLAFVHKEPDFDINFTSDSFRISKGFGKKFFLKDVKEKENSTVYEFYYAGMLPKNNLREHIANLKIKGPTFFHIEREADFKISPGFQTTLDLKLMSIRDY